MPPASDSLNAAQLEAVHHLHGPCLILAGAGSGKTRVITHKIARLLQAGYAPGQIAAITFTNKAAQEMRERAKGLVGARAAKGLVVSTFHALGVRILRSDGERLGLKPRFSILDGDDVLGVLKDAGTTTDNAQARRWQWAISRWKNEGLRARRSSPRERRRAQRARVMQRYEERLAAYQAVDFDDLIGLPLQAAADRRRGASGGRRRCAICSSTRCRTPTRRSTSCCACSRIRSSRSSPPWATTTRASTAGAARRSRT